MSPSSQTVDPSVNYSEPTADLLAEFFPDHFEDSSKFLQIKKLAGDASSRRYYRIEKLDQPTEPVKPHSYVLQVAETFQEKDIKAHPFVSAQKLLNCLQVPVPQIYGVASAQGWVLLQDLGDETLQGHPSLDLYKKALDSVVEWTLRAQSTENSEPHFSWAFDFEKLQAEMKFTAEHLVTPLLKRSGSAFLSWVRANSQYLADRPRYFCHRDYHSRNIMFQAGQLFVIDFQDARLGPLTYDVASLLWDPYVRLSESWRFELLKYWKDRLSQRAQELRNRDIFQIFGSHEQPWEVELERMKIQRLLKAAGSYASFYNKKGRTDYLPALIPAVRESILSLEKLKTLQALSKEDAELLTELKSWEPALPDIIKLK